MCKQQDEERTVKVKRDVKRIGGTNHMIKNPKLKNHKPVESGSNQSATETLHQIFRYAVFFSVSENLLARLINLRLPGYMSLLNKVDRRSYVSNSVSLLHSCIVSFMSLKTIWKGMNMNVNDHYKLHSDSQQITKVLGGYFVNDLIQTRQVWMERPEDLFHHMCGIILSGVASHLPFTGMLRFIPHVALVELSTIFLNMTLLIRGIARAPRTVERLLPNELAADKFAKGAFALTFFACRCLMFPRIIYEMHSKYPETFKTMGWGTIRPTLGALCILQYYWLVKIVRMVTK